MSKVLYQVKLRGGLKKGLGQRDLVNEVVLDYAKTNPASTLADLQRAFPLSVQKKLEIVVDESEAQQLNASRKQYSIFEQVRSADGRVIAVCNQWGVANIGNFLDHARQMGYQIIADGDAPVVEPPKAKPRAQAAPSRAQTAPSPECYNGQRGIMAIIGNTAYFWHEDCIYSLSIKGKQKAKKYVDLKAFYEYRHTLNLKYLYAWNGKLYFYCYLDGDVPKLGFCPHGIFTINPATHKPELFVDGRDKFSSDAISCYSDGKAYGVSYEGNQFITVILSTGEIKRSPMPSLVTLRDWAISNSLDGINTTLFDSEEHKDEPINNWEQPLIRDGFVYITPKGSFTHVLRFLPDNPERIELLQRGLSLCTRQIINGNTGIFATSGERLIAPLYDRAIAGGASGYLYAWDAGVAGVAPNKRLSWMKEPDKNIVPIMSQAWNQCGPNFFAFKWGSSHSIIFDIGSLESWVVKNTDFVTMNDIIIIGESLYAIGSYEFYCIPYDINILFPKEPNYDNYKHDIF